MLGPNEGKIINYKKIIMIAIITVVLSISVIEMVLIVRIFRHRLVIV